MSLPACREGLLGGLWAPTSLSQSFRLRLALDTHVDPRRTRLRATHGLGSGGQHLGPPSPPPPTAPQAARVPLGLLLLPQAPERLPEHLHEMGPPHPPSRALGPWAGGMGPELPEAHARPSSPPQEQNGDSHHAGDWRGPARDLLPLPVRGRKYQEGPDAAERGPREGGLCPLDSADVRVQVPRTVSIFSGRRQGAGRGSRPGWPARPPKGRACGAMSTWVLGAQPLTVRVSEQGWGSVVSCTRPQ